MERVREPERTPTREHKAPPHRDRGGASAVEMRKKIEVPVAVIEVERVPSHVKPEQRKPDGVGPEGIAPPAATHEVKRWKEQRKPTNDQEIAHRYGLARESRVARVRQHLGEEIPEVKTEREVERSTRGLARLTHRDASKNPRGRTHG